MNPILEAALFYRKELNISVIPVKIWWSEVENKWMKNPTYEWKPYQSVLPTEEEITKWFKDTDNQLAIVTGEINNLYVFDLDFHHMTEKQKVMAEELFPDSFETLIANSPGGGQHFYCGKPHSMNGFKIPGFSGGKNGNNGFPPWVDIRGDGNLIVAPPSVRPDGKGYSFLDGQRVSGGAWSLIKDFPINIYNILIPYVESKNPKKLSGDDVYKKSTEVSTICLQDGTRNESLNKVLFHLYRGGMNLTDGTYLSKFIGESTLNADGTKRLKMDPKTVEKTNLSAWEGANKRSLVDEAWEWVCLQNGYFLSTDFWKTSDFVYKVSTRNDKKNLWIIMNRFADQGLIDKHPTKSGWYRKRDQNLVEIDLEEDLGTEWEIDFPLDFHRLVYVYPKQIIVIYSSPDGGKSAYLFDFMKRNMVKFSGRINYFSSEMGGKELGSRLIKTGITIKEWKKNIKVWERNRNFGDVVNPNDLNIIDFLEVHEDFNLVAKYISQIWERLIGGIAIVVLQSKFNSDLPRGAEFAMEKARLAFTLLQKDKHHLCKITKAKNWKDDMMNPNNKVRKFKIWKGCEIKEGGDWMFDSDYEELEKQRRSI